MLHRTSAASRRARSIVAQMLPTLGTCAVLALAAPAVTEAQEGGVLARNAAETARGAGTAGFQREAVPLFALDWAQTRLGDVPRGLFVLNGSVEAADSRGRRWVKMRGPSSRFQIGLDRRLPERFTIETEVIFPDTTAKNPGMMFVLGSNRGSSSSQNIAQFELRYDRSYDHGGRLDVSGSGAAGAHALTAGSWAGERILPIRISGDAEYIAVWVGDERLFNLARRPLDAYDRGNAIEVNVDDAADATFLIGPIRMDVPEPPLGARCDPAGRMEVKGMRFARGSAAVPENGATALASIAAMLRANTSLKLQIDAWAYEG